VDFHHLDIAHAGQTKISPKDTKLSLEILYIKKVNL